MYIAIDFDGTCVTHEYPKVGEDVGAVPVLQALNKAGHKIILNTMRSGKELEDAKNWFIRNNVGLYSANENPTQKSWTDSPKVYAHVYIDDAALGCPLKYEPHKSNRPFVNWPDVVRYLSANNVLEFTVCDKLLREYRENGQA